MKTEIANPITFPNWNTQVSQLEGATVFHTSNWAAALSSTYGYLPNYFIGTIDSKIVAVAPMMDITSVITGHRAVGLPFTDHCDPLCQDTDQFKKLFEVLKKQGLNKRWRKIEFRGGDHYIHGVEKQSFILGSITLDKEPDVYKKRLKSATRRNIAKAEKSGLDVKILQTQEAVNDFFELNCITRKKHGLPPQPYIFFKNLYHFLIGKNMGFVCLAYYRKKAIAGVVFLYHNNHAVYKYGASHPLFLQYRPNNLVMWEALKWCCQHNIKTVDLGRTEHTNEGLLQFKRGWNAIEAKLNYYLYDLQQDCFVRQSQKVKSSYKTFRILPIPVLKILGKMLYRHIG